MATADELINDARTHADGAYQSSISLINQAQNTINGINGPFIVSGPKSPSVPTVAINSDVPEFNLAALDMPPLDTELGEMVNLPDIQIGTAPSFDKPAPTFVEPAKPANLRQLGITPPSINTSFTFPTLPSELEQLNLTAPTLVERAAPTAPELQLPVFDAVKPIDNIAPPTDLADEFGAAYRSAAPSMIAALEGQMDAKLAQLNPQFHTAVAALEAKLTQIMVTGNVLSTSAENAIYERSKEKTNAEYARTRAAAQTDAAKRGFTLPNGVLVSAAQQARQGAADMNARAATEIAVKQAELAQQNIQFSIDTSLKLRSTVLSAALNYHGNLVQINGQAMEYAKAVLSAMVEVYNTLIKAFQSKLEAYKAEAAVYETRLKGVLAVVDIYKAEITALEALTKVDMAKVELYKGRLEGLNTLAKAYQSRIEAVISQSQVEKMKVELFGAQVQAYAVEAQAKNAEWQGYSAAVNGQEARMKAFGEEARAYAATVDAFRANVQAKEAQVRSITSYNQGVVAQYVAAVDGYKSKVDAQSRIASTQIEYNRSKLYAFQASVGVQEANARLALEYYKTKASIDTQQFGVVLQAAVESAKLETHKIEAAANVAVSGARVYEGLASAALSGMNSLITKSDE